MISDEKVMVVSKLMSGRTGKMGAYIAVLLISVGKKNFENDAIRAAIKMINEEFKECCIIVADTLQKFNIATEKEMNVQDAYIESLVKGDLWLERYQDYFKNTFTIPYKIYRWDDLISDPEFSKRKKFFSLKINQDPLLQEAMTHSICEYGKRLRKRLGNITFNKISDNHQKNCFSYLEEECIAITLIPKVIRSLHCDELSPCTIVYPGTSTKILTANRDINIKSEFKEQLEKYDDFLNWLPYRFNKLKYSAVNQEKKTELKNNHKTDNHPTHQIDIFNKIFEAQLDSVAKLLNPNILEGFYSCVLDHLLNLESYILDIQVNSIEAPVQLANLFVMQAFAMLYPWDSKISNQYKGHMVRILKKRINIGSGIHKKSNFEVYI